MLSEDSAKRLIKIAYTKAIRLHLPPTVQEDYASAFLFKCSQLDPALPLSFFCVAGHHAGVDALRHASRYQKWEVADDTEPSLQSSVEGNTIDNLLRDEVQSRIAAAVQLLTIEQREIWHLCINEDRSAAEVAALLGKNPSAVRQALAHTRKRLRKLLSEREFGQEEATQYLYLLSKKTLVPLLTKLSLTTLLFIQATIEWLPE